MRTWIKAPLAILADNTGGGLVVENGKIAELVPSGSTPLAPVDATYDAGRHVVLPGLINSHHHFFQTLSRAHPGAYNKALFPWLQVNYPMWAALDRDMLRIAARLAYTELLVSGCTTATDHNYVIFEGIEDAVDIEVEEAQALGIRTTVTRGSLCQTFGDMPPPEMVQDDDTVLADSERVLRRYHDTSNGAMVQIALAPCAQFSVSKRVMRESAALAERYNCRLHTHLAETLDEEEFSKEVFGYRPVDWLDDVHWMQPRTWVAHGIHFTDEDIARLGAASVGVAHCPSANAVLASGFCRTLELEAAGSTIGLGVDGSASNDSSNLIQEVRQALMLNRLGYLDTERVTHRTVLRWASEGSAALLGRADIGRIAVGMQADLALFTLDEMRFSGQHDPIAALVHCGAHRADRVMVAGRWLVEDGHPVGVDVPKLIAEHSRAAQRFAPS